MRTSRELRHERSVNRASRWLRRIEAGESYDEVGRSEGLHGETVRQTLVRVFGLAPRHVERADWRAPDGIAQQFRAMWGDGVSITEIGRRLGVSRNAVEGARQRLGLPERGSPIGKFIYDWSVLGPQVIALRARGLTWKEISKHVGVSPSALSERCRLMQEERQKEAAQ